MVAAFRRDGRVLAYSDILQTPPFRAWLGDLDGRRLSATSPPLQDGKSLAFAGDSILIGGNPILGNDASHLSKTIVRDPIKGGISATVPFISGRLAVDPTERLLVSSQGHVADLTAAGPTRRAGRIGASGALAFSADGATSPSARGAGRPPSGTTTYDATSASSRPPPRPRTTALAFSPDARARRRDGQRRDSAVGHRNTATHGAPVLTAGDLVLAISLDGDVLYVAGDHLPYQRFDLMPEDWAAHFPGYPFQPTCGRDAR
ncbi:hypothetical protein [Nonomuraea sp. NPDC001023]|uniref:hypothetical protein n=1 Tax=unclassified Nonomuraea TaxID=2593643 RepID=UPI0033334E58